MLKDAARLPLAMVQDYTKRYPGLWDTCELLHSADDIAWDKSRCYLPIAAGLSIACYYHMPMDGTYLVPALASWRRWKEVYTFDPDLAAELFSNKTDTKLPAEILMSLPFPCVFVEAGEYSFFVHLENDIHDGRWELRFARILPDGSTRAYFIHIGDFTLSECLLAVLDEAERVIASGLPDSPPPCLPPLQSDGYADTMNYDAVADMLQLVLYLCASNADIRQPEENRRTYRPSSGKVCDKYREIRKWDAGAYIGGAIRRQRNQGTSGSVPSLASSGGTGTPKRPHIRRGHWHHFWRGTGDNRELALHWVFPIAVNADDGEASPRVNPVDSR